MTRSKHSATVADYYQWLLDKVLINDQRASYWLLIAKLFKHQFYYSIPNDDNRAVDGQKLREKFCEETGQHCEYSVFDFECTILEVLIALAYRAEFEMQEIGDNLDMKGWFWLFLRNLDLEKFTDDDFGDYTPSADVILHNFVTRSYAKNGKGGLFPLASPHADQRKVEIWYQFNAYVLENYYVEG